MNTNTTQYEIRPVVGYEGEYSVSNTGQVFSHNYRDTGQTRELKLSKNKHGYITVGLRQNGEAKPQRVHRLVLMAFVPNPENKPCCDHIDADRANNHVSNLRWATHKENCNNPITLKNLSESKTGKKYQRYNHNELKPVSDIKRMRSEANIDRNIYTLRNIYTNDVFIGIRCEFIEKYNLDVSAVSHLIKGNRKMHKGWMFEKDYLMYRQTDLGKVYSFMHKVTGEIFKGTPKQFVAEYGLAEMDITSLVRKNVKSVDGWMLEYVYLACEQERLANTWTFIHVPTKKTFTGTCNEACKALNLGRSNLGKVVKGEFTATKGWMLEDEYLKNPQKYDKEIRPRKSYTANKRNIPYIFKNTDTGEVFTGIQRDFRKKYNLNSGAVSLLTNKKIKSTKGWILVTDGKEG